MPSVGKLSVEKPSKEFVDYQKTAEKKGNGIFGNLATIRLVTLPARSQTGLSTLAWTRC